MNRFLPFLIVILLGSALLLARTQAQEVSRPNELGQACRAQVVPFVDMEEAAFFQKINQHFQNRSDNSELIGRAMELLAEYQGKLNGRLKTYNVVQGGRPIDVETREILLCAQMVSDRLQTAKDALRRHIVGTAQAKKSTRLMEKYKAINAKLRTLNRDVGALYGYFKSMQNLGNDECFYLSSCVGR